MIKKITEFFIKNKLLILLSAFPLLLHLYTNIFAGYGIFRDEFYYLACSNRLDLGYVDQPPLSIYFLAFWKFFFGDSLFAIRLAPAIAHSVVVFLTGLITKKMGGNIYSIILSSIGIALAPIFIGMNTVYSMNCIGMALWAIAFYYVILLVTEKKNKYWIYLGIITGLGALNKIDFLWFGLGLFIGIIFTEHKKSLRTIWPYIAAVIALIIFSPYIIWNINNDYAHLEFIRNATTGKYSQLNQITFLTTNVLIMNPVSLIIWLPGIFYLFLRKDTKQYKILGIIFLTVFFILFINGRSKAEYLASAYPVLFSAGSIWIEKISRVGKRKIIAYLVLIPLIVSGLLISPITLPILPVEKYIDYSKTIGIKPASSESKKLSDLPQFYADMFGWEDLAIKMNFVYNLLYPYEKGNALILARNYGEAGAIEYYKKKYNLPPVISFHNNYWIWAADEIKKGYNIFIVIGGRVENHYKSCEEVALIAVHTSKYAMPYENNIPVYICTRLKIPVEEIWKKEKHFE